MKKIIIAMTVFLISCSTIMWKYSSYEYCGNVDLLDVFRKEYSFLSCEEAMTVTRASYNLLQNFPRAGSLKEHWRVEYMWGSISIDDPYGTTFPEEHVIKVKNEFPNVILHELYHAYMFENHSGGRDQHRVMCRDKEWKELEYNFDVPAYCHLVTFPVDLD